MWGSQAARSNDDQPARTDTVAAAVKASAGIIVRSRSRRRDHPDLRQIGERQWFTGSCRGAHASGGLSHRRPKTVVDQVTPESIPAAPRDITCRAFDVHVLAVGTCAIN